MTAPRTARRQAPWTVSGIIGDHTDPPQAPARFGEVAAHLRRRDESLMEWLPTALTGDRVVVRTPAAGDAPALVEMATDAQVRRYIGGPVDHATAVTRAAQKISDPQWGQFVIVDRATGVVAGSGSLARKRGPWEISYQLRPPWWRQGLTTEAVSLILGWFFTHTDEDLVIATTQHANTGSRRLLERLGATHVGSFEQYGLPQERYEFYRPPPQTPPTSPLGR